MKTITIRPDGSKDVSTINNEPSKTDQQWKKSCDVNEIVKRYIKTGQITHTRASQAQYADVSQIPDLLTALNQVQSASDAFQTLPSQLRKKLNNSPLEFIEYLKDSKNDPEAIALGLKNPLPVVINEQEITTPSTIEKPK